MDLSMDFINKMISCFPNNYAVYSVYKQNIKCIYFPHIYIEPPSDYNCTEYNQFVKLIYKCANSDKKQIKEFELSNSNACTTLWLEFIINYIGNINNEKIILILINDITAYKKTNLQINNGTDKSPVPSATFKLDNELKIVSYSDKFYKLTGFTLNEFNRIINDNALDLVYSNDRTMFKNCIVKNTKLNASFFDLTYRINTANKIPIWVNMHATKHDMSESNLYDIIFTNIFEKFNNYNNIFDDLPFGILIFDSSTYEIYYVNKTLPILTDLKHFDFKGKYANNLYDINIDKFEIRKILNGDANFIHTTKNNSNLNICSKTTYWMDRPSVIVYITEVTEIYNKQKQLSAILDQIPTCIACIEISDGKFKTIFVNNAYSQLFSCKNNINSNEINPDIFQQMYDDDDIVLKKDLYNACIKKTSSEGVYRLKDNLNSYKWIRINSVIISEKNHVTQFYCCFTDVDDNIRQKQTLKETYDRQMQYNKLTSTEAIATCIINLNKNIVTIQKSSNKAMLELMSYKTPMQMYEQIYKNIPDSTLREEFMKWYEPEKIMTNFYQGISHYIMSYPFTNNNFWIENYYNAVENPITGDIEIYCIFNDISQTKVQMDISEALLLREYESVMLINSKTGRPIKIVDFSTGRIFKEQENAENYIEGTENYFRKYIADKNIDEIISSFSLHTIIEKLKTQSTYTFTYSIYDINKNITHKRISFMYINEYRSLILCRTQDISKDYIKHYSDLKNRLNVNSSSYSAENNYKFLSNVSYGIRTPINTINCITHLAKEENQLDKKNIYLSQISQANNYLMGIIDNIVDISQIENGKFKLTPDWHEAKDILLPVFSTIIPIMQQKNIIFEYPEVISSTKKCFYYIDCSRFQQMIINLLQNACQYTNAGGKISLTINNIIHDGENAVDKLTIQDTGCGMTSEFIKHIFEPFAHEEKKYTSSVVGTGLGLPLARYIAQSMGGDITVESELNTGSKFTVVFSYKYNTNYSAILNDNKTNQDIDLSVLNGCHIILAEDHPLNALIETKLLENQGIIITHAENGKEAVDLFVHSSQYYYDAIIMDIRMPVMDGITATKTIRTQNRKDSSTIPIIAMTANVFNEDRDLAIKSGISAYLAKPIDNYQLYRTLTKYINLYKKNESLQKTPAE